MQVSFGLGESRTGKNREGRYSTGAPKLRFGGARRLGRSAAKQKGPQRLTTGEVVEWLKAPASKAGRRDERLESSNLSLSAITKATGLPPAVFVSSQTWIRRAVRKRELVERRFDGEVHAADVERAIFRLFVERVADEPVTLHHDVVDGERAVV